MKFTLKQYEEIVLTLENEGAFHRQYTRTDKTVGERRSLIQSWLGPAYTPWGGPRQTITLGFPTAHNDIEDREQIRRYFDDRYEIACTCTKYDHLPSIWKPPKPVLKPEHEAFIKKVVDAGGAAKWLNTTNKGGYTVSLAVYHQCSLTNTDMKPVLEALKMACLEATKQPAPKEKPIHWKDELEAARAAGATLQIKDGGVWVDEVDFCSIRNTAEKLFTFGGSQSRYRVKPPSKMTVDELAVELTPTPTPKETPVSKPIIITTTTFANSNDISKMADGEIFNMIAEQEAEIEALKKIKAQPKKLVEEIAKREAGIAALVAYLDNAKA